MSTSFQFDFEGLNVYRKALEFTSRVFDLSGCFTKTVQYSLGDQFRRAALSICNNLAEGSGKTQRGKVQFYTYALNSAREYIPIITIAEMQKQISSEDTLSLRRCCIEITSMLFNLIRSVH